MTTIYNIGPRIQGVNGFGLQYSDLIYTVTLADSTNTTLTVPGGSGFGAINSTTIPQFVAIFSYTPSGNVYVSLNAAATVPAGDTFAKATAQLNPSAWLVNAGDVINVISAAANDVCVAFYSTQEG